MVKESCFRHHFNSLGRCTICQMQTRYYANVLSVLNSWSKRDKNNPDERWQEKVDSYEKCEPHYHNIKVD